MQAISNTAVTLEKSKRYGLRVKKAPLLAASHFSSPLFFFLKKNFKLTLSPISISRPFSPTPSYHHVSSSEPPLLSFRSLSSLIFHLLSSLSSFFSLAPLTFRPTPSSPRLLGQRPLALVSSPPPGTGPWCPSASGHRPSPNPNALLPLGIGPLRLSVYQALFGLFGQTVSQIGPNKGPLLGDSLRSACLTEQKTFVRSNRTEQRASVRSYLAERYQKKNRCRERGCWADARAERKRNGARKGKR